MTKDAGLATDALRQHFRSLAQTSFGEGSSKKAVLELLCQRGYALHADAPCRAGVLALESYRAVKDEIDEIGLTAAAAVELHMEAAYAFDDISDSDVGQDRPTALAVALAVLAAGYSLACEVANNAGTQAAGIAPLLEFHQNWSIACDGFLMDAHLQTVDATSLQVALDMTRRKSGSLGRFAAGFGAGLATNRLDLVAQLGDLGESLLTYRQLVDDLRDACSPAHGESDLSRHKKTVPLVYFYNYARENNISLSGDTIIVEAASHAGEYEASGAPLYGAIVAETFLNRAKSALANLKAKKLAVRNLESLVAAMEAGSCDTLPACS